MPPEEAERKRAYVLRRLAAGDSIAEICRNQEAPSQDTVYKWVLEGGRFAEMYAQARQIQAERLFDELLRISDQLDEVGPDGKRDRAAIDRARLMIDTRKWILAKMLPKKYGDLSKLEISGNPLRPLKLQPVAPSIADVKALRDMLDAPGKEEEDSAEAVQVAAAIPVSGEAAPGSHEAAAATTTEEEAQA